MKDNLNLQELSEMYQEATAIGNPSPPAIKQAIGVFPRPHSRIRVRMAYAFAGASAFLFWLLAYCVSLSADTDPGTPLYPVKRGFEALQTALAVNQPARFQLHLTLADKRIREAQQATGNPSAQKVALEGFKEQVAQLRKIASATDGRAIDHRASMLVEALVDNVEDLTEIAEDAPVQEQAQIAQTVEQTQESLVAVRIIAAKPALMRTLTRQWGDECDPDDLLSGEMADDDDLVSFDDTDTDCDSSRYHNDGGRPEHNVSNLNDFGTVGLD